jgi:RimJ/RimL family protein N-acetyltransferase
MASPTATAPKYPREAKLSNGTAVTLRTMAKSDRSAILKFAKALPEDDLLFLRVDITSPEVVDEWLANIAAGNSATVLAYVGDQLAGYATVHRQPARWTRRVGEIRINAGPKFRGMGLGRRLTSEIFDVARSMGLKKLTAQMTPDQSGARSVFEHLGFQVEAILTDWVEDRKGKPRDLLVMSYDLDGFTDRVDEPLRV